MPETELQTLEVGPAGDARASVIWLHGLGADGYDFETLVPELGLIDRAKVRFVLPHAPYRPVTLNGGQIMRAWYDIRTLDLRQQEDEAGIRASGAIVEALIAREAERGVPSQRVILAGFSQGGAVALHTGLRYGSALAGVLALSTYLPLPAALAAEASAANRRVPILMAHGLHDDVVPLLAAQLARQILEAQGYAVDWHAYSMGHALCPDEIVDLRAWLARRLG
ncbi:MAG: dienelactone hydrolase family protein [Gammaproteobacteria bacterium]